MNGTRVAVMRKETFKALQIATGWDSVGPIVWTVPPELIPWLESEIERSVLPPTVPTRGTDTGPEGLPSPRPPATPWENSIVCEHLDPGSADEYREWLAGQSAAAAQAAREARMAALPPQAPQPP